MKILLIEDDRLAVSTIKLTLKSAGFSVDVTHTGHEGINLSKHYDFNLIILDLMLPDINGDEVLSSLRNANINVPIIVITATSDYNIKNKILKQYADDYLVKPYNTEELLARIRAVIRRVNGHANSQIKIGNIIVDITANAVFVGNQQINLTDKEYKILSLLAIRKGITLSKETFLNHIYIGGDEPELKIIDVFICKLRKKIAKCNNGQSYIYTVWGRGYVMRDSNEHISPSNNIQTVDSDPHQEYNKIQNTQGIQNTIE